MGLHASIFALPTPNSTLRARTNNRRHAVSFHTCHYLPSSHHYSSIVITSPGHADPAVITTLRHLLFAIMLPAVINIFCRSCMPKVSVALLESLSFRSPVPSHSFHLLYVFVITSMHDASSNALKLFLQLFLCSFLTHTLIPN